MGGNHSPLQFFDRIGAVVARASGVRATAAPAAAITSATETSLGLVDGTRAAVDSDLTSGALRRITTPAATPGGLVSPISDLAASGLANPGQQLVSVTTPAAPASTPSPTPARQLACVGGGVTQLGRGSSAGEPTGASAPSATTTTPVPAAPPPTGSERRTPVATRVSPPQFPTPQAQATSSTTTPAAATPPRPRTAATGSPVSGPPAAQLVATSPGATNLVATESVATKRVATRRLLGGAAAAGPGSSQWPAADDGPRAGAVVPSGGGSCLARLRVANPLAAGRLSGVAALTHQESVTVQARPGGFRVPMKSRAAAFRMLAISVLALVFPATALGAGTGPAKSTTSASNGVSGAPTRAAHARSVLAFGSGYSSPGGSQLVRILQRDLAVGGYPPGHIDGRYGPLTRHAVLGFQAAHGLVVDGIVGPRMWAALSHPVLILGLGAGDQPGGQNVVRSLQRRLASAGDSPGPIDGRYGVLTEAAVKRFQRAHGLPVTGMAGPRLRALVTHHKPSERRASPLPEKPAPATTRSKLSPRPTGSTVAPAPREHPASPVRRAPRESAQRPRSGSVPWVIVLGGLALALALILVARLLIASLRHAPPRREGQRALPERTGSDGGSAVLERTSDATPNGEHRAARTNGNQIHTNGHRARATTGGNGNGANTQRSGGGPDHPPKPAKTAGAFNLGQQFVTEGGVVEAHAANGHADERGHGIAASNLGRLLEEQGALAEAEAAYRHADELGDSAGAFHLGRLLEDQGGVVEAQAAYGRADERGHGIAASNLGRLLEEQGALAEAEAAYRRADERGDADGAFRLAVLLRRRGALDDAAAAYGRASGRGHDAATLELGLLSVERGALADAEAAFGRADELGDAVGAFNLGVLLEDRGAVPEAEAAYRRADAHGDADGAFRLGILLSRRGALDEAAAAYGRASARGHNPAALELGLLFAEHGALGEAEAAYRQADERGDAAAAFNLGILFQDRGALADAEAAYLRARGRGDREVADMAQTALLDLDQHVEQLGANPAKRGENA
jgi:uncharacterized protein